MPFIPHTPWSGDQLFRPSRPDFIETEYSGLYQDGGSLNCSGLLGRTSLRPGPACRGWPKPPANCSGLLGRTSLRHFEVRRNGTAVDHCSGLLGRTSLRLQVFAKLFDFIPNCSGLLGRTSLRLAGVFIPEKAAELIVPAF